MKMSATGNKELHNKYLNDPVLNILMKRKEKYERTRNILIDSRNAFFVFVLTPEKLPIIETQKAITILAKYGIQIGGIIINKVLPDVYPVNLYSNANRLKMPIWKRSIADLKV